MTREMAIIHILTLCASYKAYLHWQIVARVALGSLFLDARITAEDRDVISGLIASQKLLDYERLLVKG